MQSMAGASIVSMLRTPTPSAKQLRSASACRLLKSRVRPSVAVRTSTVCAAKKEYKRKPGFKYDPAMQRWVRDDKLAINYEDDGFDPTVVPKSGGAYTLWPVVHSQLMDYNLKSIGPEEVMALQKRGCVLLDVREEPQYNKVHAAGAINVPLFVPVQGNSLFDNAKRLAMAAFAMEATERNPKFAEELRALVGNTKTKIVVICATGGTLKTEIKRTSGVEGKGRVKTKVYNDPERAFGRESRSLKACYEVLEAGYTDVMHVDGGLNGWRHDDYPIEWVESD
mmetsp:Transcript_17273/g.33275  ORF Transcript_17273/g.33275 Transcript_17273/m.33275 type:complete len:281 (+) Transcript_17273:87-929(+)